MEDVEFCRQLGIESATLELWLAMRWILPRFPSGVPEYTDTDLARANLIIELLDDFELDPTGVDVLLLLLDQIHGLRAKLEALIAAIQEQDEGTRQRIASHLLQKAQKEGPYGPAL